MLPNTEKEYDQKEIIDILLKTKYGDVCQKILDNTESCFTKAKNRPNKQALKRILNVKDTELKHIFQYLIEQMDGVDSFDFERHICKYL